MTDSSKQGSSAQLWQALGQHLDRAQSLLGEASGRSDSSPEITEGQLEELVLLCAQAEQRARREMAKLVTLEREMELLSAQTVESLRAMQRLAFQDPLTGLANLHLLREHLESLPTSEMTKCQTLLFIIDVDRFQELNALLSRPSADFILIQLAQRLGQLVGPNEVLAHRGEDEFLLVFSGFTARTVAAQAARIAAKISALVEQPLLIDGHKIELTVSQGASHYPGGADTIDLLLTQADRALTFAKKRGRNQFHLYNDSLGGILRREARIEFEMRDALEADEFVVDYLPIIFVEQKDGSLQGRLLGVEALLRWHHRREGVLEPAAFLPLAERNGFVVAMGQWVIQKVCRQLAEWEKMGLSLYATVNLSGRQLLQQDVAQRIESLLEAHQLSKKNLVLEINEESASLNETQIESTIAGLYSAGFSLAIDRFGSGYSSPGRLAMVDFLKLSQRLLEPSQRPLMHKALAIARALEVSTICVGVDSQTDVEEFYRAGFRLFQGFFFSEALEGRAVEKLVNCRWNLS